ncbi:predicted protein, partial [Thalassiosira pseudonana CCMP1335]
MGKVRKKNHAGIDATFIGRAKVLKRLQISLKDFRRLCILKGVYPREPRGRAPSNKKGQVFYHIKDVKALNHEPLLDKFREFRTFMKKIRKSANRNEKDEARRKEPLAPRYTLHHLVRERYPRFNDALADLDDALCLISLFAALPSDGRIKSGITRKAKELSASWGAYCSVMGCVTKSFISVKGVYLEAAIQSAATNGQSIPIRWVQPHNFTQYIPEGVDFRVMLTFFEFYETLLGFVMFKLYGELGIRYPLQTVATTTGGEENVVSNVTLHPTLGGKATSVLAANLNAKKRHQLFHNLTFFLSREVPRGYLELIILSFGGQVGWEGQDSPIAMDDASITHHVVDRPALLASYEKLPKSREYIQPQWILDSANFNFVLPITKYGVGKELPPHLSPWVEDKEEGYVPKYREEVEALKNGEVLEDADSSAVDVEKGVVDSEGDESSEEEEIPSHIIGTEKDTKESGSEEVGSEDEEEED